MTYSNYIIIDKNGKTATIQDNSSTRAVMSLFVLLRTRLKNTKVILLKRFVIIFLPTWFTRSKKKRLAATNYQSHLRHQTPVKSVYIITHRKEYIT